MDTFGPNELKVLSSEQGGPCVSVYLPTHVAGEQGQQDPVRLKNLLQGAEEQLSAGWMRAPEARELLKAARKLPDNAAFWGKRSHGLAIFVAPQLFCKYRLPLEFDELLFVNRRFHIKPLLPMLSSGNRFLILALSQNNVRLFTASQHAVAMVDVPGLPASMPEALNYTAADRGLQVHSGMRGSHGKQAAVFHGQGGQPDTRKEDLALFFRMVDAALHPVLRDETAPLLLAGVEYLLPIYREVNSYSNLAPPTLSGNCDYLTAHQIHQRAWPLMEPIFHAAREVAVARYHQLAGTGKASSDIRQIVTAAHEGKVETLFVDVHALQWGLFHPEAARVELHDTQAMGDEDLLDLAAAQTLLHRGTVYSVERASVPGDELAAAVYRY
jgi:hypothetical protein